MRCHSVLSFPSSQKNLNYRKGTERRKRKYEEKGFIGSQGGDVGNACMIRCRQK